MTTHDVSTSEPALGYAPGQVIAAKYLLEQRLAEGRVSEVWRARNTALGCDVALKLLRGRSRTQAAIEHLLHEARVEASLRHPGVVRVFDVGPTEAGAFFLAMELLEGPTLAALLAGNGRLEPVEAVRLLLPVAGVLCAVHARGLAHGDLQPANVVLVPQEGYLRPTLVDFGAHADGMRRDPWSVCCMLYQAAAGRSPFENDGCDAHAPRLRADALPSISQVEGGAQLGQVLARGLADDPAQRFGSARELAVALARFLLAAGKGRDATGVEVADLWLRKPASSRSIDSRSSA